MHSTPDAVLMLHHMRQRELMTEAAHVHDARQVHTLGFPLQDITAPSVRFRVVAAQAVEFVRSSGAQRFGAPFRADAS